MVEIDRFKFEDKDFDFPIYNKNPYIPKWGWVVLFVTFLIGTLLSLSSNILFTILGCIVYIVPVLYFLKWDYNSIFKRPSSKDILLVVALFIGYFVYAILMGMILKQFGIVSSETVAPESVTVMIILIGFNI